MGAQILYSPALTFRPAYYDDLQVYPAQDGQVLFQVYSQKKDATYYILKFCVKLCRLLGRKDITNPNGVEIESQWDDEDKAIEHCRLIRERYGPDIAVGYAAIVVNRAYPLERCQMEGLTDPTRWLLKGNPSHAQARYTLVDVERLRQITGRVERLTG